MHEKERLLCSTWEDEPAKFCVAVSGGEASSTNHNGELDGGVVERRELAEGRRHGPVHRSLPRQRLRHRIPLR